MSSDPYKVTKCSHFQTKNPAVVCPNNMYVSNYCAGKKKDDCKGPNGDKHSYCVECSTLPRNVSLMQSRFVSNNDAGKRLACENDEIVTGMCLSGDQEDCCVGNDLDNNNCKGPHARTLLQCTKVKDATHLATVASDFGSKAGDWCAYTDGCTTPNATYNPAIRPFHAFLSPLDLTMNDASTENPWQPIAGCTEKGVMQGICKHSGNSCKNSNFSGSDVFSHNAKDHSLNDHNYALCKLWGDNVHPPTESKDASGDSPLDGKSKHMVFLVAGVVFAVVLAYVAFRWYKRHEGKMKHAQ